MADVFPAGWGASAFLHICGGYWRLLRHWDSVLMAATFVSLDTTVGAVNYSFVSASDLDIIVCQCQVALAWDRHEAASFGANPERIFVAGSSAGDHLIATKIVDGRHEALGSPADIVKGVRALSRLSDLEATRHNSSIHHLPDRGCRLMVSCGGNGAAEFKCRTDDSACAWGTTGFPCTPVDNARKQLF